MSELLSGWSVCWVTGVLLPFLQVFVALVTLLVLIFTLRWSNRAVTRGVRPQIDCFLRVRPSSHVFDFVIANSGMGSAYGVGFRLDIDEEDFAAHGVYMKQRRTETPFPLIEPSGEITTLFGFGPQLLGQSSTLRPFTVTVTYAWLPFWSKGRVTEVRPFEIDVRPYSGLVPDWKDDPVAEVLKTELPKIVKAVEELRRTQDGSKAD